MAVANVLVKNTSTIPTTTAEDKIWFAEGATPVDTNIDFSAFAAGGLSAVYLAHPWTADVGSSTAPFTAEISFGSGALLDNQAGGGTFYYHIEGTAGGGADVCDLVRSHGPGNRKTVLQTGGTATAVEASTGSIDVGEPVTATTVRISGSGVVNMPDSTSTDPTLVEIKGGTWNTERGATTVVQFGGQANVDAGTNVFATVNLYGGVFSLLQSGTITTVNWFGGILDVSRLGFDLTITTLTVWGDVDQAALQAVISNDRITITNPIVYRMRSA